MTEPTADQPPHTVDQATARVLDWWENHRGDASRVDLVVDRDRAAAGAVVREVHRRVPGSVLLDATGKSAEGLLRELLAELGVLEKCHYSFAWGQEIRRLGRDHLVLIDHALSAGPTRRSAQPGLVVQRLAEQLRLTTGIGVVLAVPPEHKVRKGRITLRLAAPAGAQEPPASPTALPLPVQALAFSEPRRVPPAVWRELITAATAAGLTAPDAGTGAAAPLGTEAELLALAERFPDHLRCADGHVGFRDESTAEAIRRAHGPELPAAVGRHLVAWLRERAADFHHPDGWAASGPVGRYAADGIAVHAVQAGLFEELVGDGTVVAQVPPDVLVDAAHCAHDGSLPGGNAAADAVHLRMYGLSRPPQPAWAAWLHLMATARNDTALADGIARSGVRLPWRTLWTHWRPPGGFHHTYLRPGALDTQFSVRWQGRPAVLSVGEAIHVWELASGALLAGPWAADGDFPAEARSALAWAAGSRTAPGPASIGELRAAADTADAWQGALEELLHTYLDTGFALSPDAPAPLVLSGAGGLLAVQPRPGVGIDALQQPDVQLLLGNLTAAGPAAPADAPAPAPRDLADIYGTGAYVTTAAEDLPEDLTDATARRVLTGTGLPEFDDQGLALQPSHEDHLQEVPWPEDLPEQPDEQGPFHRLGRWMGGFVVLDGPTGHVLRCPVEHDDPTAENGVRVATDLENFLTMAGLFVTGRRILTEIQNRDEAHLMRQHIDDALFAVDGECSDAGAWQYPLHEE
ncbi:SUKH-4 family immunity protein [Streptomyces noursei]|uniref:SUKH-4 family immunity protein n=1 Tax=Streptomyces noursei TaxID=1971 RepID=UPI00196381A6|nr:SUKH-4 family immunity protein [Streptomyces noursei]QRX92401.1 SUKH-4 family immunity protein [Streptomyces noursei]